MSFILKSVEFVNRICNSVNLKFSKIFSARDGEFIQKYPNGQIKTKGYYRRGLKTERWYSYFENGKLEAEGNYQDGQKEGKWVYYYFNPHCNQSSYKSL